MRKKLFTMLLAGLALCTNARAGAKACQGLELHYHESIAGQGFLGLSTPRASFAVTRAAFARVHAKLAKDDADDVQWSSVCLAAKARGATHLWIGCRGDSTTEYGPQGRNYHDPIDRVSGQCLVATPPKSHGASWGDLVDHALTLPALYDEPVYGNRNRHDELSRPELREELYVKSLQNSLEISIERIQKPCNDAYMAKSANGMNPSIDIRTIPECRAFFE